MLARYHIAMTRDALGDTFGDPDLETIIKGNLSQDNLSGLLAHPEYHFDNSDFAAGETFIADRRQAVADKLLQDGQRGAALYELGRLLHTRQDFYAHSNWVRLWTNAHGGAAHCAPADIELCTDTLHTPGLISGDGSIVHFVACQLPLIGALVRRVWMPADSHEAMNLDHPGRGPLFPFAIAAATRHTRLEFEATCAAVEQAGGAGALARFRGR